MENFEHELWVKDGEDWKLVFSPETCGYVRHYYGNSNPLSSIECKIGDFWTNLSTMKLYELINVGIETKLWIEVTSPVSDRVFNYKFNDIFA